MYVWKPGMPKDQPNGNVKEALSKATDFDMWFSLLKVLVTESESASEIKGYLEVLFEYLQVSMRSK